LALFPTWRHAHASAFVKVVSAAAAVDKDWVQLRLGSRQAPSKISMTVILRRRSSCCDDEVMHQVSELDTLGYDRTETKCKL
jgi:hypothetical protein